MPALSAQPGFIEGGKGRLFVLDYPPRSLPGSHYVIFIPPFGEEMNRSRRMAALQAQSLSARGYGVLLPDLYGTGDSAGDFADARWEIWHQDIDAVVHFLLARGVASISLWGLRLGALLALDYISHSTFRFASLVLWQPTLNGHTFITQFLRLRLAAGIMAGSSQTESTTSLRAALAQRESLEIAGYELASDLVAALDAIKIESLAINTQIPIYWFDLVAEPQQPLPVASARVIEAWLQRGIRIEAAPVLGEPFWSLQETTLAPLLLETTSCIFQERL